LSRKEREKGARIEREIVDAHKDIGVHAERYPLSGASNFRGSGHDIDLYIFGKNEEPVVAEVKARGNGEGFTLLEKWLADYDVLFLRRDRQEPLVVLPWRLWAHLVGGNCEAETDAASEGVNAAQSEEGEGSKTTEMT
jgi:Holliday junction resolvase